MVLTHKVWGSARLLVVLLHCVACVAPQRSSGNVAAEGTGSGRSGGSSGGLRWVGRVDASDPSAAKFAWQGAGVVATVVGPTIAVKLRTQAAAVYFQPVIDGKPGERFKVTPGADAEVTLATGLTDTAHSVELYRETEGSHGVSAFLGFTAGTVTSVPVSNGRLVEVVGDSISAGYGNLGKELHPNWVANPACTWTAENSSWYATYAAVAGRALDAEVSTVARSGWGMYRDRQGSLTNVLPNIYENALGSGEAAPWSFERKAAAVVVNLGTNDWNQGDPGPGYEKAYIDFIATVRGHYPDAFIFLTIGSMTGEPQLTQVKTRLANVVAAVRAKTGDDKLVAFDMGIQNLGPDGSVPTGCDWHPSTADHERMAGILRQQLASKLGW